jgi:hypothetical protein
MLEVSQKFEKTTDFSSYKTWAWMAGTRSEVSEGDALDLDTPIREAVEKQMTSKGFAEVDEKPDVMVKYHVGYRVTAYTTNFGMHYQEKVGWSETETVRDGQLTIDMVDTKSEQVVWRGTGYGAMNVDPNQDIVNTPSSRGGSSLMVSACCRAMLQSIEAMAVYTPLASGAETVYLEAG